MKTQTEKLITVVVPVFKVEQYIDKCLTSLIVPEEQLPLLEVLVVNDGTPDRSADMAREYEKRYPGVFRVIDKENGGHGSAWNRGLKEARGKYLKFLDSDDWFTTSEFSRLITRLQTLDVDVILSHYNRFFVETGETILHPMYKENLDQTFPVEQFHWDMLSWEQFNFWGCTYRTTMLQKEYPLFLEHIFYDYSILFIAPVLLSRTIHVFNAAIYNYLIGRAGQTVAPEVIKRNLGFWKKSRFQIYDFTLSHMDGIHDSGRKEFLFDFLKKWLHYGLVKFSEAPYKICKEWSKEWTAYYYRCVEVFPGLKDSSHSIRCFFRLPFPIYYAYRRILSHFYPM